MEQDTDETIALRVQSGNSDAFGVLVLRYEPKLLRYGRKFLSDPEDIKDLVQEVFIKSYTNIQGFDTERKFSSWIYRIAHNEFVNALKKKGRESIPVFDFDLVLPHLAAKETADADTGRSELRHTLDRCLEKVTPKYREVLVLYYFEELDYREIADVLRVPAGTVGVRLARGRAQMKELMKEKKDYV